MLLVRLWLIEVCLVESYNILVLCPHRSRSHANVCLPLAQALSKKGHQVTVVSHFPLETPIPNYVDINLGNSSTLHDIDVIHGSSRPQKWSIVQILNYFTQKHCNEDLRSPSLRRFFQTNQTYDVIIAEFFNSDCFLSVIDAFKAPLVGLSPGTIMHWTNEKFGSPSNPSYIPNNNLDYSDRISFFGRVENLLVGLLHNLYYDTMIMGNGERIAKEFFGRDLPPLKDIVSNSSLLLVNSHFSLNLPRPLVPGVVEIGGMHITRIKRAPEVSTFNISLRYNVTN